MKENKEQKKHVTFPFRFTKAMLALSVAALFLCALGGVVSVFRIVKYGVNGFNDFIRYPFLILVCILGILLIVCLLFKSEYVLSDKYLHSNFGLIRSKIELKNVTAIVADLQEEKITVYMGESYFVMLLKKTDAQDFSKAILESNPDIDFSYTMTDDKPNEKDKENKQ